MNWRTAAGFKVAAFGVLAAFTAGAAGLGALSLAAPGMRFPLAPDIALVREMRAHAALTAPTPDPERAAAESRAALALAPMSSHAWTRLAYVAAASGMTAQAAVDMERSYAVAPFGPSVTSWRLALLYEQWRDLPPSLRTQANQEMRAYAVRRSQGARALALQIRDPAGRMAALANWRVARAQAESAERKS